MDIFLVSLLHLSYPNTDFHSIKIGRSDTITCCSIETMYILEDGALLMILNAAEQEMALYCEKLKGAEE